MSIAPNPLVVAGVLRRFSPLTGLPDLQLASSLLSQAITLSMQFPAAYNAPLDQSLPAEAAIEDLASYVHPYNVACALVSLSAAAAALGGDLPLDPSLMIYQTDAPAGWQQLLALRPHIPVAQVTVEAPAPPPPAPAIPPAPPAAAAPPPASAAPAAPAPAPAQLTSLLDAALGTAPAAPQVDPASLAAPVTTQATLVPVQATPVIAGQPFVPPTAAQLQAEFPEGVRTEADFARYRGLMDGSVPLTATSTDPHASHPAVQAVVQARQPDVYQQAAPQLVGAPDAPRAPAMPPELGAGYGQTAQGATGPAVVTLAQAKQESSQQLLGAGLPDPSVLAGRVGPSGKDQKSPFLGKIELRKKLAEAPWWWQHVLHSAPRLFVDGPAQALDPTSTGTGPVQAYAALVALVAEVLRTADPELTVAELRTYLAEVATGIESLDGAAGALQLAEALFKPAE